MSRIAQPDQVIDDEDVESCPLCIEELDLSDRNFFPCPCGYQVLHLFTLDMRGNCLTQLSRYVNSASIT